MKLASVSVDKYNVTTVDRGPDVFSQLIRAEFEAAMTYHVKTSAVEYVRTVEPAV